MKHDGSNYVNVGIQNTSGSSCYISSATQLLIHAIHEDAVGDDEKEGLGEGKGLGEGGDEGESLSNDRAKVSSFKTKQRQSSCSTCSSIDNENIRFIIHFGNLLNQMMTVACPPPTSSQQQQQQQQHDNHLNHNDNGSDEFENMIMYNRNNDKNSNDKGIDASDLYKILSSHRIDSSIPGDAATALRTLLQLLRKSIEYICDDPSLQCLGRINNNNDNDNDIDIDNNICESK